MSAVVSRRGEGGCRGEVEERRGCVRTGVEQAEPTELSRRSFKGMGKESRSAGNANTTVEQAASASNTTREP